MVLTMQRLQALACDMSIDLRRGQGTVPKQQLDDPKIRTVIDQMRRKGMAHGVR